MIWRQGNKVTRKQSDIETRDRRNVIPAELVLAKAGSRNPENRSRKSEEKNDR